MRFEGVFPAHVTPFAGGEVDFPSLEKILDRLIDAGVHGLVPCGTTGETPTLSPEEWRRVVAVAVAKAKPKSLPVIAGCGGNNTRATVQRCLEAKELGCQGALISTPYYNKSTPAGLRAHFHTIAEEGGLPVVVYNVPGRTAVNLSATQIAELLEHPNIVAVKEASGDHSQWIDIMALVDINNKSVMAGDDDCMATLMAMGGTGIISASANVAPKAFVAIYDAARAGDWEKAFHIQKELLPVIRVLFRETNPAPAKAALAQLGLCRNELRLPLVPVEKDTEALVEQAMKAVGATLDL